MQIAVAGEQSAHTIVFLNHLIRNEDPDENNNIIFIQLSYSSCLWQEWMLMTLNLVIAMVIMSHMVFPSWWFWDSIWENIGPTTLGWSHCMHNVVDFNLVFFFSVFDSWCLFYFIFLPSKSLYTLSCTVQWIVCCKLMKKIKVIMKKVEFLLQEVCVCVVINWCGLCS